MKYLSSFCLLLVVAYGQVIPTTYSVYMSTFDERLQYLFMQVFGRLTKSTGYYGGRSLFNILPDETTTGSY